jgi:hypothetical protein
MNSVKLAKAPSSPSTPSTSPSTSVRNLTHITRDRGYRFVERDADLEWVCNAITDSNLSIEEIVSRISRISHSGASVSPTTLNNWMMGKTKRPQNYTLTWVAKALGYKREWIKS